MSYVRHRDRSVKYSFKKRVEEILSACSWFDAEGYLGQGPVEVVDSPLSPSDLEPVNVGVANRVFVDFGNHHNMSELQLGSGLVGFKYPVFVDVLARNSSTASMIAEDIRDHLLGDEVGSPWVSLVNAGSGAPLSGFTLEVFEVFKELPDPKNQVWVSLKIGLRLVKGGGAL